MFKDAMSGLASGLISGIKEGLSEYKPTAQNMGGAFTRIAEQGIANLSYRSPILADVAATMLHSFQQELIHRDMIKHFAASDEASSFREDIKKQLGKDATDEDANKEMFKVIDKLNKIVSEEGDAAKDNDFFKKNQKLFEEFKKSQEEQEPTRPQGGSGSEPNPMLERIEANTHKTVDILSDMNDFEHHRGNPNAPPDTKSTTPTTPGSFVDPYTGLPSIRAAIGGIGGNFLAKVFDDETISKYASKTREKLFGRNEEPKPKVEPATSRHDDITDLIPPEIKVKDFPTKSNAKTEPKKEFSVASILGDLSLDLASSDVKDFPSKTEPKKESSVASKITNALTGTTKQETKKDSKLAALLKPAISKRDDLPSLSDHASEDSREETAAENKRAEKSNSLQQQVVDELKKLNENFSSKGGEKSEGGISGTLKSIVGNVATRFTGAAAPILGTVAAAGSMVAAGNIADSALGEAGVGGHNIDEKQDEANWNKSNWWQKAESGVARGIENVGSFIGLDNMSNEARSKRIAAETEYLSAKIGNQPSIIQKMQDQKKEAEQNSQSSSQQASVVAPINNTTNNNSNTTIVAPSNPRNQDSTFDRVQQSNIWGRTA